MGEAGVWVQLGCAAGEGVSNGHLSFEGLWAQWKGHASASSGLMVRGVPGRAGRLVVCAALLG